MPRTFDPQRALDRLTAGSRESRVVHVRRVPARPAVLSEWPSWVDPTVYAALAGQGVTQLWSHQRETADLAHGGQHVVCATGTASGKSLGYLLPVLSALAAGTQAPTGRGASALYLSPTKALAGDQWERLDQLALPDVRCATYDGDTAPEERRWIREHAHYVLTNPDLVHHSLLPGHQHWAPFLRALRYVVVDECHVYRGVFGAHLSAVLRRLLRVAARYGARPTVVFASATVADPARHAGVLIGQPVVAVTQDGSPREATTFALWEPPLVQDTRRSALAEAGDLLADLVLQDVQTVTFARSRVGVEVVAQQARRTCAEVDPALPARIAAYRGGYLPEERRELERRLRDRDVLGLAATNALELGVDIAGLDAVLIAGWPGTRASLWQQAGRAGRAGTESLAVLVAADDPLDSYLVHHPEAIFDAPVEASVVDPANPHVLGPHLAAAASELPLTVDDVQWFGPTLPALAASLVRRGVLRDRPAGWYWARPERPTDQLSLRGIGETVRIVEAGTGRVLGTVDQAALAQLRAHRRRLPAPGRVLRRAAARPRRRQRAGRPRRPWVDHAGAIGERLPAGRGDRRAGLGCRPAGPRSGPRQQPGDLVPAAAPDGRGDRRARVDAAGPDSAHGRGVVDPATGGAPVRRDRRGRPAGGAACRRTRLDRPAASAGDL